MPHLTTVVPRQFAIDLSKEIENMKKRKMYKTVNVVDLEKYRVILLEDPSKEFSKFVVDMVTNYMNEKDIPGPIASSIRNIADDVANSREVIIRAGDYIALQSYYKSGRKTST